MQLNLQLAMLFVAALVFTVALSGARSTPVTATNNSGEGASYASARANNPKLHKEETPSEFCKPARVSGIGALIRFQADANFSSQALTLDALPNSAGSASHNSLFISELLSFRPRILPASSLAQGPQTVEVTVAPGGDLSFSPDTVSINVGDTVRWTFGSSGHNVVSGNPCTPDNKFCSPGNANCSTTPTSGGGAIYTRTFDQAGTFPYFCSPHCFNDMTGVVIVAAGPTPTPTPAPSPIQLMLDQSGPAPDQASALDSVLFVRDPFPVVNGANSFNPGPDRNTRVIIFVTNLQLAQGETSSSIVVNLIDGSNKTYDLAAEDVRPVPNFAFTQVIFRLPNDLPAGTCTIKVKAHGQVSNPGTMRI